MWPAQSSVISQVFTAALVALSSVSAWGSDYHSPRTAALGGAGHAGPLLNDSIYLNPSYSTFIQTQSIGFGLQKYSGDNGYYGRLYNLSVQDGRSALFAAGAGYTVKENGAYLHMGAAKSFIQRTGFGLGAKFYLPNSSASQAARDLNFSFSGILSEWMQLSFTIDNLLSSPSSQANGWYREFIVGTKANVMGILLFYIDPHYTPDIIYADANWGIEFGTELTLFKDVFLRGGFFNNANVPYLNTIGKGFGFGLGWIAPRISLDYAFYRATETKAGHPATTAHTLGATVYF